MLLRLVFTVLIVALMPLLDGNLPGCQVFSKYVGDVRDPGDGRLASKQATLGYFFAAKELGIHAEPVDPLPDGQITLSSDERSALKRLLKRAKLAGINDTLQLLTNPDAEQVENMFTNSFQAGMSMDVKDTTVQQQIVQEMVLLLKLGHTLCYEVDEASIGLKMSKEVRYRAADGTISTAAVSCMFPGTSRTVKRVMDHWWSLKGGRPTKAQKSAAKDQADSKGTPIRWNTAVLYLVYWQAQLLQCIVELSTLMAAKGWSHPSQFTSGAQYASTSVATRCRHAAYGVLAASYQLFNGGRGAELFRWRWTDSFLTLPNGTEVPLWTLGLARILRLFQEADSTGFFIRCYHAKYQQGYATPEPIPILPPSLSGLCLASCVTLAFTILQWLQPVSPAKPILVKGSTKQTRNNAVGWVFPFGGLQHVHPDELAAAAADNGLADLVSAAESSTGFLSQAWDAIKAAGGKTPPAGSQGGPAWPKLSLYSFRYLWAGEFYLLKRQLAQLPSDIWQFYLGVAGRSNATNSFMSYVNAYTRANGSRLRYVTDLAQEHQAVPFRKLMFGWSPVAGNARVFADLTQEPQQLSKAENLATVFKFNPSTPDIYDFLVAEVQTLGLFGMLQRYTVALVHSGYALGPFQPGPDLQKLHMSPVDAQEFVSSQLAITGSCNLKIYSAALLPNDPPSKLLLQAVPDLICFNTDQVKLFHRNPAAQTEACLATAATAVATALHSAAAVAHAAARGDQQGAAAAAAGAATAAAEVMRQAQALQQAGQRAAAAETSAEEPELPIAEAAEPAAFSAATVVFLPRGAGVLVLLGKKLSGKGKPLRQQQGTPAAAVLGGKTFTHVTLGMVAARDGVLLEVGKPQQVNIRVAEDFILGGSSSRSWGSKPAAITLEIGGSLLLWAEPEHAVPKRCNFEELPSYSVLYRTGLSDEKINSALGKLSLELVGRSLRRACCSSAASAALDEEEPEPRSVAEQAGGSGSGAAGQLLRPLEAALAALSSLALSLSLEEAAEHNAVACAAVLPLLRSAAPGDPRVQTVREGLQQLYLSVREGKPAVAAHKAVEQALRALAGQRQQHEAAQQVTVSAEAAAAEATGFNKRKRAEAAAEPAEQALAVDDIPCELCGAAEGTDMLVCEWCCSKSAHLSCLGLEEVPAGVWLCSSCEAGGHQVAAEAAAALHGRWVLGSFPGVEQRFWGQLAYVSYGSLRLRYSDGEEYTGVRASHVLGQEQLVGHLGIELQAEGCAVPAAVVRRFKKEGCLSL